jgi:hypothetical protein
MVSKKGKRPLHLLEGRIPSPPLTYMISFDFLLGTRRHKEL